MAHFPHSPPTRRKVIRIGRRRPLLAVAVCAVFSTLTSLVLSPPLTAQVRQYTPPGGSAEGTADRRGALETAVEEARWHAGPVRLDPAFWISDLAWVDSPATGVDPGSESSATRSDITGRAGAGIRAYLPVGAKTTFAAYALPEYVWWNARAEERRLNQRFGIGSFTYFNRLAIALTAQRDEEFDYATGEILQRYTNRYEALALDLELPLLRRLSFYAQGADIKVRSLVDNATAPELADFFRGLDRDDLSYRGGVRYYPDARVRLGAGVGHSESAFAPGALERSNAGDFWYTEVGYNRPKLRIDLIYQQNRLRATTGSEFADFDDSTGSARLEWRPRATFSARVYSARSLAYSLLLRQSSAYVDQSVGAGVELSLGWRLRLNAYGETGSHRYQAVAGALPDAGDASRVDDVTSFGIDLGIELIRKLNLRVGYQESRISPPSGSGLPGQKISQVLVNLGFGFGQGTWYEGY
jgi:hypothetical protein